MKLLLVEDDSDLRDMLAGYLGSEHFTVVCAADGQTACEAFDAGGFSLVLLDLMLPNRSGLEVLAYIRAHSTVPVLILSARDGETDKTLGLALGADDYITKPFSVAELLARIQANIRRATRYANPVEEPVPLRAGSLILNPADFTVTKAGRPIDLTAKEFDILKLFLQHPKRVYTKEQIYALVWKEAYLGEENAVNVHISRLRAKIEDDPRAPRYLVTVWGIGYKLGELS